MKFSDYVANLDPNIQNLFKALPEIEVTPRCSGCGKELKEHQIHDGLCNDCMTPEEMVLGLLNHEKRKLPK